jgi:hypothetical protein
MKITGPQTPGVPGAEPDAAAKGPGASDKVGGTEGVQKTSGAHVDKSNKANKAERSFAETLAAGRTPPVSAPRAKGAVDPLTSDIAAELKAGKLAPEAALDRVVERVLDKQLGADAPAALRDQVRNALRDTISSDPMIADRLRGLS